MYTATARGSMLRDRVHKAIDREVIDLDPLHDIELGNSDSLDLPPDVTIRGKGRFPIISVGVPFAEYGSDDRRGCGINLNEGSGFEDCTLAGTCGRYESCLVGFDARFAYSPSPLRHGFLRRCDLLGQSWCVYVWPSGDARVELDIADCTIQAGRIGVCLGGSNRHSQQVSIRHSRIAILPELVNCGGAISAGTYAIAARGGTLRAIGVESFIQPDPTTTRQEAALYTDSFGDPGDLKSNGRNVIAEILGCHSRFDEHHAVPYVFDIIHNKSLLDVVGGSGSDAAKKWRFARVLANGNVIGVPNP